MKCKACQTDCEERVFSTFRFWWCPGCKDEAHVRAEKGASTLAEVAQKFEIKPGKIYYVNYDATPSGGLLTPFPDEQYPFDTVLIPPPPDSAPTEKWFESLRALERKDNG